MVMPDRCMRQPFGRTPKADHMPDAVFRRQKTRLRERGDHRARHNDGVAVACLALLGEDARIERLVQHQGSAAEEPGDHRHRQPAERGHRHCRQDGCFESDRALEQGAETAGNHLGVAAGDRNQSLRADVEGHHRKMRAGWRITLVVDQGQGVDRLRIKQVVKANDTVGWPRPKPAHIAYREYVGRRLQCDVEMILVADPPACDQRPRAGLGQGLADLAPAPQQR